MKVPSSARRSARIPSLPSLLLGLLAALLLLTLILPQINPGSWLGQARPLVLGPADQPIATLTRHSLLYKSDNRGLYLVVRSQWQLLKPLQAGDKVRVELLNDKGERIDQLSQAVEKRQRCNKGRCTLDLNSTLRAPDDALASRYQLRIGLLLADRPESAEFSQILQTLPEQGFNLTYLFTSLVLVLALSAAVLKALLPKLRRSLRWRIIGSLLLGNLTFVLLHGFVVFKLGEFLLWSGFRPEHYYLAWGSMVLGWSLCALAGFNLYMGLVFTALSGIGLLANFMKIAIYGVPLGGDDLGNLLALLRILLDQHPVLPVLGVAALLFVCWRFALSRWVLRGLFRTTAATAAFFALCVFATQTGNKLLGANIRYVDRAVNYHRDLIRSGPGLYLFNLVDEMLQSGSVFRYPLQINEFTPQISHVSQGQPPRFDLVIVLQYESLWLGWQGRICAPPPTLSLPASVQQWQKTIHSPTTGGMTVLAEFEMNTGLPVGLLKQGVVPYYYLSEQVPGLAQSARQSGYHTLFAHPYVEKFWGRAKAMPALGYEERWFDTRFTSLEHKGLYISDDALIDHLLRRSEQETSPLFAYAVTMQGHGPFDGDRYQAQQLDKACPDQSAADRQLLNTYYTGVVDAMASLERLLKRLDNSGKRYLVVAFGDHQPFLMSAGKGIHGDKPPRDASYQIPMMAFTRDDGALSLERQFAPVRQLYQMGQATRQLLAGDLTPIPDLPLLHPVLGEEKGFDVSPLVPQIRASFRANALP
ncbi:LTA synthase family protein [Aeromonas salmonicida]|uniref:LTA synthase family protein n=1 Tax=Aeromonas salmonicida TaxID=645 RepID=UPI000731522A|nr:alkaline phosphatase family protein [Aeromonas salmonicida]KTA76727.1 sulfatase [Aeromonas salmonicida]RSM26856.1 sulfatase [Aeromonas salmonicida]